jgi:endonuclease/exonuclease/phosphatase family metal-dependent hydrolase
MKAISFNLKVGVDSHLSQLAADLYQINPDIAVFQEIGHGWQMGVPVDQSAYLCSALSFQYRYFAPALQNIAGGQFGISLISRFPISDCTYQYLPQIKDEQRVLLSAKISSPEGDFWLFNTHLSIIPEDRAQQIDTILQAIEIKNQSEPLPILLMGDFNEPCHSQVIQSLCQRLNLIDCWLFTHPNTPIEEGFSFSVKKPNRRIDYLLVKGFTILECHVLKEFKSSDHFPISAQLTLTSKDQ